MSRRFLDSVARQNLHQLVARLPGEIPLAGDGDFTRARLELALVSPVYGGGHQPGVHDDFLFRVPAIRGQLRFWWRATRACAFLRPPPALAGTLGPVDYLRLVEGAIWGITRPTAGADRPPDALASAVRLQVRVLEGGSLRERRVEKDTVPLDSGRGYVYFPGRATKRGEEAKTYWWGPRLELSLSVDLQHATETLNKALALDTVGVHERWSSEKVRAEVTAALWAWTVFGGYGARTRRGAGALQVLGVTGDEGLRAALTCPVDNPMALVDWIAEGAKVHVAPAPSGMPEENWPECPVLASARVAVVPLGERNGRGLAPEETAMDAVGDLMFRFRQDREKPRGRSRWPEADAIRTKLLGKRPEGPVFFPRAVLGLPIVFHFKSAKDADCDLVGQAVERMASPICMRPVRLGAAGSLAAVVVVFNTPWEPPGGLALQLKSEVATRLGRSDLRVSLPPEAGIEGCDAHAKSVPPLAERHTDNALTAFLRHLQHRHGAVMSKLP